MTNDIANFTEQLWRQGRKIKTTQSNWLSGNAVCCQHLGHNPDTRGRGGLILSGNGNVSWHCFNCGFKTGYMIGKSLGVKFKKLLSWMGASNNEIQRLVLEALRIKNQLEIENPTVIERAAVTYQARSLPSEARSFWELVTFYELQKWESVDNLFKDAVLYIDSRKISMQDYPFYWTPQVDFKLNHRVIIPMYYQQQLLGYTARALNDGILPKYHSDHPADIVFNLDKQTPNKKFVIVVEGPFDAMSIDGVSVQTNEISDIQADLINDLNREVIVVPDFDKHVNKQGREVWPGRKMIRAALENGWSVSFPIWSGKAKDVNDAVVKYGKLFTLKSILEGKESNPLKIQILMNKQ